MGRALIALLALFGATLYPTFASADSGKDCKGPLCDAFKHPQERKTKPIPCVPVRFDQWRRSSVAFEIKHPKLGTRRLSSEFGEVGQRCFGEQWLQTATVTICDDDKSFVWTPAMIEKALSRQKKVKGLDGTLKGTEWYKSHPEKYDRKVVK